MPRLAIVLTAILSISACGGGSSSGDPSNPQSVPPLTFELFDPSGTDNQIAQALRDSADKNKQFINFAAVSSDLIYEDGTLIDRMRYSISPDSTSSNIRINAVSVTTQKEEQLELMLKRVNYKHDIARINLLDTNENTVSFGLVFPYGIVLYSPEKFIRENSNIRNISYLLLVQGHALHMGTEEWAPRDTKITFGGGNTRTAGFTYLPSSSAYRPLDYPFQLTLELVYKGYSNQHEVTLNVSEYKHNRPDNRFPSSALAADFTISKLTLNPDSLTNPLETRESNPQNPNTFMFNSDEHLSFSLQYYDGAVITDPSKPTFWIEKSAFEVTIFGTDMSKIYIAGIYKIEINETANTLHEYNYGVFVLPKL